MAEWIEGKVLLMEVGALSEGIHNPGIYNGAFARTCLTVAVAVLA